jgi:excisionase family DNA binding protein
MKTPSHTPSYFAENNKSIMPFMVDEECLVRPDESLRESAGYLRGMMAQAQRAHAEPIISVPQRSGFPFGAGQEQPVATVRIPAKLVSFLLEAAEKLSQGRAIALVTLDSMLTTHQAARLLGVSRPHLIKLLEEGKIPYNKVGSHRRILLEDVLRYREKRGDERQGALDEMTRKMQEEGVDYMGKGFVPPEQDED